MRFRLDRPLLSYAAALVLAGALHGGAPIEALGQAAGAFARMGFGARGVALSNALIAEGSGAASAYYNPALVPFTTRQNLEASVAFLTFDRELQFLQFSAPLPPKAGIAAGLIHAGVTDIDGRNESGFHTENLSTDEYVFFLAFGLQLGDRVTAGIGLQLFRADLYDELEPVNSAGLDVGVTVRVSEALRLGVVADDLLAKYSWDTSNVFSEGGKSTTDLFPTRLRVGAAYALLDGRARLLAEYETRITQADYRTSRLEQVGEEPTEVSATDDVRLHESRVRVGAEYLLSHPFTVRAGLDRIGSAGLDGMKPTAGFMVEQPVGQLAVWVEYAFALEPYAIGTMHFITLRLFL